MALATNQLYGEAARGPLKRIQPDQGPGAVVTRLFKTGNGTSGSITLPVGTPVYIEAATGFMVKVDPSAALGATNAVAGIVWPSEVTISGAASTEVHGTVMLRGSVHYDDIAPLSAGYSPAGTVLLGTLQQLKDILRQPSVRERGIYVEGLTLLGGTTGLTG